MVAQLKRLYERESGFLELSRHDSYPYMISVRAPSFAYMIEHLAEVKKWQEEYEESDLAPFLVYEKRKARATFGPHKMLAKICFNSRFAFEHWIAPDKCQYERSKYYRLLEKAHFAADYVRHKPYVQTLAEKLRTNRSAMTESELFAVRTEPLFIDLHTVPIEGSCAETRGTVLLAGADRLLHGKQGDYLTADLVNERAQESRAAQSAAFNYAITDGPAHEVMPNSAKLVDEKNGLRVIGGSAVSMPDPQKESMSQLDTPEGKEQWLGAAAHHSYHVSHQDLTKAALAAIDEGNLNIPPPPFAIFGIATSKIHYVDHTLKGGVMTIKPWQERFKVVDARQREADKLKAQERTYVEDFELVNPLKPKRPEPDFFMSDSDWAAYFDSANPLDFGSIPGSFAALDEIKLKIKRPLYPGLSCESSVFSQRLLGLESFIALNPRQVATMAGDFLLAVQLIDYLAVYPQKYELYCRQLALPQMDSKFIERNYSVLHELCSLCLGEFYPKEEHKFKLPDLPEAILPKPLTAVAQAEVLGKGWINFNLSDALQEHGVIQPRRGFKGFLQRWGFKDKPDLVRMRLLDPSLGHGLLKSSFNRPVELSLELEAIDELSGSFQHVIVCENESSFLALPQISNTIAIFGSGYAALMLAFGAFMHVHNVIYWGDIDTHGFDILNRLRLSLMEVRLMVTKQRYGSYNPDFTYRDLKVRSMFMDKHTLLSLKPFWVKENKNVVQPMVALSHEELDCYEDLIAHKYGSCLRLEQEYIPYHLVLAKLQELLPQETITAPKRYC